MPLPLQRIGELGPLRLGLLAIAGVISLFATPPGTEVNPYGWDALTTLVLPAAAPLVLFVILFDVLMSCVQLSAAEASHRAHWHLALWADLVFVALLVLSWWPFFQEIFTSGV